MSVAHGSSGSAGFALPSSFLFAPASPPKGVVVLIIQQGSSSDQVTGVTYGGVAMTRVATAADTAGEPGRVYAYFLGRFIPAGSQSVAVSGSASTVFVTACSLTSTLNLDTEAVASGTVAEDGADPQISVFSDSRESLRYIGVFSGHDATASLTLLGSCTAVSSTDFGTQVGLVSRQTNPSGYTFTLGYTAASEDRAAVAIAISEIIAVISLSPKIYCRKPHSILAEGSVEFGTGGTPYADIQHPTEARVYVVINSGITVLDISNRAAPSVVGTVTAAAGLIGNQAIDGLAFDSTGRYLYATSGTTSLYTFDLGAALVNKDNPTLVDTDTDLSQGNGLHVVHRDGTGLRILADTVTNNSYQVYSIATPSNPALSSTTAMTGNDIEAAQGIYSSVWANLFAIASDASGKILAAPNNTTIQLPTVGGNQIRPTGLALSTTHGFMAGLAFFSSGGINHYFWMVYQSPLAVPSVCRSETIVNGAIASLNAPIICSSPKHAELSGHSWNDGSSVLHIGVALRDDSFGEVGEIRFYAWGVGGDFSRVPRPSGGVSIPGTYSLRARNQGTDPTKWMHVGISADRSNAILALSTSDLLKSVPSYLSDWFNLTPDAVTPGQEINYGIAGDGPRDRLANTGTFVFELDNSEVNATANLGGYSPDSPGPITTHFKDGSLIVRTIDNGAGDEIDFYGTILTIAPAPGRYEDRLVRVTATDGMEFLMLTNVEQLPLRTGISTEEALRIVWDRVPYAPGTEILRFQGEHGTYIHDFTSDRAYSQKTKVAEYIKGLLVASRGAFFYRHFGSDRGMTYVSLDEYLKGSVFFGGAAPIILDSALLTGMDLDRDITNIYNSVTVRYYPRRVETNNPATTTLFEMEDRILIKAGESVTIDAQYRDPGGKASRIAGTDIIYPVVATDFTLRPQKNGGGASLNAQLSVSVEIGATGSSVIAANAGPLPGWFKTKLRGNAVYTQEPLAVTVRDADSITKYGLRELIYDAQYISDEAPARDLAELILEAHREPRSFVSRAKCPIDSTSVSKAAGWMGLTRKLGVQETVSGLTTPDHWAIGTGQLDDTSGSDSADLYGLDIYSVQRVKLKILSQGLGEVELDLVPEDIVFRVPGWIDPKNDWNTGEPNTKTLLNLHLEDCINALWHDKKAATSDLTKTSSTAFADIPGLSFDVRAGETWQFVALIFVDSNTTADAKVTAVAVDVNGVAINSSVYGRMGLWGPGNGIGDSNTTTFGAALAFAITGTTEETVLLSGRISSPVDATIKIQGAQNTSDAGATTFRTSSPIATLRVESP